MPELDFRRGQCRMTRSGKQRSTEH